MRKGEDKPGKGRQGGRGGGEGREGMLEGSSDPTFCTEFAGRHPNATAAGLQWKKGVCARAHVNPASLLFVKSASRGGCSCSQRSLQPDERCASSPSSSRIGTRTSTARCTPLLTLR